MENFSKNEMRRLIKETQREIQRNATLFFLAIVCLLLLVPKIFFKVSALSGTNYFRDNWIAYLISVSRFLLFAVVIGACLFLWKKSKNQFWYGIIEIAASIAYCYHYLDNEGSLPYINWLTALYFTSRGFQNTTEGWGKSFRYKREVCICIVLFNRYIINPVWKFVRPKK